MLAELFPRANARYVSLPILGQYLEGFVGWLREEGYPDLPIQRRVRAAPRLDSLFRRLKVCDVGSLTAGELRGYIPRYAREDIALAAAMRSFVSYFERKRILAVAPLTASQCLVKDYCNHLQHVRGLAAETVKHHASTADGLLKVLGYDQTPDCLQALGLSELEQFIQYLAVRRSRASMQHVVAHLRAFLRWLASRNHVSGILANQIDTPRVYRDERLPRELPWEVVLRFLDAIDRSTAIGRRDYAMFMLITTYGLRTSEVVTLTLDDISWRDRKLHVHRPKVGSGLFLPLTDEVGAALIDHLQHGREAEAYREVFLRARAPMGTLKPTAVTEAFQAWTRRSGLPISFQGPHCLRHSLAMHLLRQDTSLKTIGDLLGHRSPESTCVYLRLHVDQLYGVALDLPVCAEQENNNETI